MLFVRTLMRVVLTSVLTFRQEQGFTYFKQCKRQQADPLGTSSPIPDVPSALLKVRRALRILCPTIV